MRKLLTGIVIGILLSAGAGIPVLKVYYNKGKEKGHAEEREWISSREEILRPETGSGTAELLETGVSTPSEPDSQKTQAPDVWCFSPLHAADVTWPVEILQSSETVDHPHFRVREGVNRMSGPDGGSCSFLLNSDKNISVRIYVHAMFRDECGNSFECSVNGGNTSIVGDRNTYGTWAWVSSYSSFRLNKGMNLVTVHSREDGAVFDKVAVQASRGFKLFMKGSLDSYADTPPPVFPVDNTFSIPLKEIDPVHCYAFPSASLVIGKGHENRITVFARLNRAEPAEGEIVIRSGRGDFIKRTPFSLDSENPSLFLEWNLDLKPLYQYLVPVIVSVYVNGVRTDEYRYDFINPLSWAFLGPFPDPEHKRLDLHLPPEEYLEDLHTMPAFEGYTWKSVSDGSCYSDLGVVDLNKVFGFENRPRLKGMKKTEPKIAYAVTCIESQFNHPHTAVAYGGDDCVQVWQNGEKLLRVDADLPLEMSRQIIGTKLKKGPNVFVFKIVQDESYWQLLFEPDRSFPIGNRDYFVTLPRSVAGIGIHFRMSRGEMIVISLMPGGPAEEQKNLFPGDRIVAAKAEDNTWTYFSSISTNRVVNMITGEENSPVVLKVRRAGGDGSEPPEEITIVRKKIRGW